MDEAGATLVSFKDQILKTCREWNYLQALLTALFLLPWPFDFKPRWVRSCRSSSPVAMVLVALRYWRLHLLFDESDVERREWLQEWKSAVAAEHDRRQAKKLLYRGVIDA